MRISICFACLIIGLFGGASRAQQTVVVRPREINDVLVNPGIGFMTFQRFNGDRLNQGQHWTEERPIDYKLFSGHLKNDDYPQTALAYFRIYWRYIEPEQGKFNWELIDKALETAGQRGQTLLLRIAPYGIDDYSNAPEWYWGVGPQHAPPVVRIHRALNPDNDVPAWYRALVGPKRQWACWKWCIDPEDPRYAEHFGAMIRALGKRYDGNPLLENVDVSIVGAWGEGAGSELLSQKTRQALVDSYLDAFHKTPLLMLLTDERTVKYALSRREVGWRMDCLGEMGGFSKVACAMCDHYPQAIIHCGLQEAWKKAPVSLEACWVMQTWKDHGWDIDYMIEQSLKWHISSFNAKSCPVPKEWWPQVNRWLKQMGYRFVLRRFTYPAAVKAGSRIDITSWWENKGVAPCYYPFRLALRLENPQHHAILPTTADIRTWLPGDNLYESGTAIRINPADPTPRVYSEDRVPQDDIVVPANTPAGQYDLDLAILDARLDQPRVKLAIAGVGADGWYKMGPLRVDKIKKKGVQRLGYASRLRFREKRAQN